MLASMGFSLMKNKAELAEVVSTKIPFAVACKAMFESRMALSWGMSCIDISVSTRCPSLKYHPGIKQPISGVTIFDIIADKTILNDIDMGYVSNMGVSSNGGSSRHVMVSCSNDLDGRLCRWTICASVGRLNIERCQSQIGFAKGLNLLDKY